MLEMFFAFIFVFCLLTFCLLFLFIPVMIASARGIEGGKKTTITLLSILGIFFGLTWVVALVLALLWEGEPFANLDNLDKLEKLSKLYKDKVITKDEYEKMKRKLLADK